MKKILLSLAAIVFVGAAAAGATGAFFSDVETSTGNTFTAGALDLKVDDVQHYDGLVCANVGNQQVPNYAWVLETASTTTARPELIGQPCTGTWTLTDLGPSHRFFNFSDVKPGDQGENTISLHVDNNAYACLDIGTNENNENTLLQPEIVAGDATTGPSVLVGELAQNTQIFGWLDNASTSGAIPGDNIWQAGEKLLFSPTSLAALSATTTLTLADGGTGSPLPGGSTSYFGLGWCAGTLTISAPGSWSCSGASMDNKSQTDSAVATVQIRAMQARNNPTFRCAPPVVVAPTTGSLVVTKVVSGSTTIPASAFTLHVKTLGNADVAGSPQSGSSTGTTYSGLVAGMFVVTEDATSSPFIVGFSGGCSATSTPFAGGAVLVNIGATSTCTVTNTLAL